MYTMALVPQAETSPTNDDTSASSLPFFPTSRYERHLNNTVSVWWFEEDFSQSSYGPAALRSHSSNACTLITLLTASAIVRNKIQMEAFKNLLPYALVKVYAESIITGNDIYCKLADENRLPHAYLNIPEALLAAEDKLNNIAEWGSFVYLNDVHENIYNALLDGIDRWCYQNMNNMRPQQHLFVVLISVNRSMLLVYQHRPSVVTLLDSHQHSTTQGSCIVQVSMENLRELCQWIGFLFHDVYQTTPTCFELSYLYEKLN